MAKKFDFIIKILQAEMERQVGKAIIEYQEYNVFHKYPKNQKINTLKKAMEILEKENRTY